MTNTSLTALIEQQLEVARASSAGRSAKTVHGGHEHALRQTVLALLAGHELGEHASPGEATLQVLSGRVVLTSGDKAWRAEAGDFLPIPPERHNLAAIDDSVVLLSVVVAAHT